MSKVVLRTHQSDVCEIPCGSKLKQFAMRWNYIVRQRHRWAFNARSRARQTDRLQTDLRELGVSTKHLKKLTGIVEVAIPFSKAEDYWEARILPWEYVLAAASNPHRSDKPILVVRHLNIRRRKWAGTPKSYALIETAPGCLRRHFDFAAERSLVTSVLSPLDSSENSVVVDPTEKQIAEVLRRHPADVIHLTGIDNRSGRQLLNEDLHGVRDGVFLASSTGDPQETRAEKVAETLCSSSRHPSFIGFNCWDSGARMAPMAIQAGAHSAVGFQHTFDDAVAELFFLNFYRSAIASKWDLVTAFTDAWDAVGGYRERIRGSSITLWSDTSLVKTPSFAADRRSSRWNDISNSSPQKQSADPKLDRASTLVSVSVRPKPQLNYSLLHNGRSLFDEFTLRFHPNKRNATLHEDATDLDREIHQIEDLEVHVHLHVGTDSFPFRTRLQLGTNEPRYDLALTDRRFSPSIAGNPVGGVRLPLTSQLIRSVSERIQTSLYAEVRWHDQILYQHTHPVWLAPVDEWTLNDRDIWWLPSFIQPRDPAIGNVIEGAQNYLRCLVDRTDAGFDGYQSYDDSLRGPSKWGGVDRQVHALWSSLVIETGLHYINPPPSYGEFTQRLRTPSQTINGRSGTCVDLAILLASALEWIEIYPVMFMLDDHAFVGYWRDLEAYQRFLDVRADGVSPANLNDESQDDHRGERWVSGRRTYAELKAFVDEQELIPLETVLLTSGGGFQDAVEEGRSYFQQPRNHAFHSMIDVASARLGDGITPLPTFQD